MPNYDVQAKEHFLMPSHFYKGHLSGIDIKNANLATTTSDARLFCKNKQVNLKNKPKISNLTERQAQHPLSGNSTKRKITKKIK